MAKKTNRIPRTDCDIQWLLLTLADNLFKKRPGIKVTKLLAEVAWRVNKLYSLITGKPPIITRETVYTGQRKCYFSNEKIRESLNFEFIPVEQSIRETCEIFLRDLSPFYSS